jgi:hypothetical protein
MCIFKRKHELKVDKTTHVFKHNKKVYMEA